MIASDKRSTSSKNTPSPSSPYPSVLKTRTDNNILSKYSGRMSKWALDWISATTSVNQGQSQITYWRSMHRFDETIDKNSLIRSIESDVVSDSEWYMIRYHLCTHDDTIGGACPQWTVESKNGNVPEVL